MRAPILLLATLLLPVAAAEALVLDYPKGRVDDLARLKLPELQGFEPTYGLSDAQVFGHHLERVPDADEVILSLRHLDADGAFRELSLRQAFVRSDLFAFHVGPRQLTAGVELHEAGAVLLVVAPPGILDATGASAATAEAFARRLGLPPADESAWTNDTAPGPFSVFGRHERLRFLLDETCCTVLVRHAPGLARDLNHAQAWFTPEGHLVAFRTGVWLDLDQPALASANATAVERALRERGYVPTSVHREERAFNLSRVVGPQVVDTWLADLTPTPEQRWTSVRVRMDARLGEPVGVPFDHVLDPDAMGSEAPPAVTPDPTPSPRPTPAPGLLGVALAVVLASALRRPETG